MVGWRAGAMMIGCAVLGACGGNDLGSIAHIDDGAGGSEAGASTGGRSTGGVRTGGRAPVPDASTGTGGGVLDAGVTDAAPDAPEPHDVYVSPTGSDSAEGTRDAPVQTIAHAVKIASAPYRVVLLAGTFDETTQPEFRGRVADLLHGVQVPAGVAVVSDEPGAARLVGAGTGLTFLEGGEVQGIAFEGFLTAINNWGGSLAISGSSFASCGSELAFGAEYCIVVSGEATLNPAGVSNYVSTTTKHLLEVGVGAKATVNGGRVAGIAESTNGGIFHVIGQMTLNDVIVEDNAQRAILAEFGGSAVLRNVTIQRTLDGEIPAIELRYDSGTLSLSNSRVLDNAGPGVSADSGSTVFEDCEISRNGGDGFAGRLPNADVSVKNCAIHANGKSGVVGSGRVIVEGTTLLGNGEYGIRTRTVREISIRASRFENNAAGGLVIGISAVTPGAGSLGTETDPGNNVILGTESAPGVVVRTSATVYAVGNTWVPNAQGASPAGLYTVTGDGATLIDEWAATDVAGANYRLEGDRASLRLAENP